jgi:uncharacterized protein (DUF2141 family)
MHAASLACGGGADKRRAATHDFRHPRPMTFGNCGAGARRRDWLQPQTTTKEARMKTHVTISTLLAAALVLPASFAQAGELTVTVTDLRAAQGTLMISVVNTEAAWNNQEKPVAVDKLAVAGKVQEGEPAVFKFNLPAGSYAVQVMHDQNDNGKLDTNFMGIPTEGYGFSNNPQVMRRAFFSEAKFEVTDAPAAVTVRLR